MQPSSQSLSIEQQPSLNTSIAMPLTTSLLQTKSILFIDSGVSDIETLIRGAAAGTEVHRLQGGQDAIGQITQTLLGRSGIESLQIVSHGKSGGIQLGESWLDVQTLPGYVGQLNSWGNSLSENADILLYGCDVAADASGKAFVNLLAQVTGADVAASEDLTGNVVLGGDWDLEYRAGSIALTHLASNWGQYDFILPSPNVVISQIYGNGGGTSAVYRNDFVELYNKSATSVSLAGWSLQYASATGAVWTKVNLTGSINAGGYYLAQLASSGTVGSPLPVAPDVTSTINLGATSGKIALVSDTTSLTGTNPTSLSIVDKVGYGTTATDFETAATLTLSNTTAGFRKNNGTNNSKIDTDDNSADFQTGTPNPRNSISLASIAPTLTLPGTAPTYTENATAVLLDSTATVVDIDSPNFNIGTLIVSFSAGGTSDDRLTIQTLNGITLDGRKIFASGTEIGTYTGGLGNSLVITLNNSATPTNTSNLLRSIAYSNVSDNLTTGSRTIAVVLNDGSDGISTTVTKTININGVNDAPLLNGSTSLYTPATGTTIDNSNWLELRAVGGTPTVTTDAISTTLTSDALTYAGYTNYASQTISGVPAFTGNKVNPNFPTLDRTQGYVISFNAQMIAEAHANSDRNADGKGDRAGFSIIAISEDLSGIELGFWNNRVWAQEDGSTQTTPGLQPTVANNTDNHLTFFTQAESASYITTAATNYDLIVQGNSYTLYANGNAILRGNLRNYSAFTPPPIPGVTPAQLNPYNKPSFLFLGDNTSDASAEVKLGSIGVTANNAFTLPENQAGTILTTLKAIDLDDPAPTLTLTQNPGDKFEINANNQLKLKAGESLDFEAGSTVTVIASATSGGNTTSRSIVINVTNVNDGVPTLTGTPATLTTGTEDTAYTINATDLLQGYTDLDNDPLTILDLTATNGSLVNNNNGTYTFTPTANFNGTINLTYNVTDNNGGTTAATQSFNLAAVNDAPNFVIGANQTVTAGSGIQTVNNWAIGFVPMIGSSSENGQTLLGYEIVSNDRADLFDGAITIDPSGKLTFKTISTLATAGVATIGVRVRDSGGTANGGVDISAVKYFTITVNAPSDWVITANADFDRDGKADILWRDEKNGWNVIWKMGTNGLDTAIGIKEVGDLNWKIVGAGDFNGDGKTDILWRNSATGWMNYWQMNDMAWQQSVVLPTVVDPDFQIAAIADFDNDGRSDILWRNNTKGWNNIWKMGVNGWQQSVVINSVGIDWQVAGVADFDADGKVDILWRNKAQGWNVVWKMDGMTQQQSIAVEALGDPDFQVAGIADFDGDGKVDILWRNKTTGWVNIWKMNGTVRQSSIVLPTVVDPDFQISGIKDIDGDGQVDILWRNRRKGWNVLWKMNGTTQQQSVSLPVVL